MMQVVKPARYGKSMLLVSSIVKQLTPNVLWWDSPIAWYLWPRREKIERLEIQTGQGRTILKAYFYDDRLDIIEVCDVWLERQTIPDELAMIQRFYREAL